MGDPRRWPALYAANRAVIGDNPDLIYPGERLTLILSSHRTPHAVRVTASAVSSGRSAPGNRAPRPGRSTHPPGPRRVPAGRLDCTGLENLWTVAGGDPAYARLAAAVAMAESGGDQYALSPTQDYGYWQINIAHGALATFDALANARAAVIISADGTNWQPWTTYVTGAYTGRC
jgi:hypothetical protein